MPEEENQLLSNQVDDFLTVISLLNFCLPAYTVVYSRIQFDAVVANTAD